jgi:hypothetical protein
MIVNSYKSNVMKNQAIFAKAEEEIQKGLIEAFELLDNNGNGILQLILRLH